MQRIVWDPGADRTVLVTSNGSRAFSGSIGRLVEALRSDEPAVVREAEDVYPRSVAEIRSRGWLGDDWVFRRVRDSPHLKRVQIETTLRCNLSCSYCYSMSGPLRREVLTPDRILSLVDEADRLGVLTIDFTGGEFLIDRQWRTYVARARSKGIAVSIHTNGTLIKPDVVESCLELGVVAVQVSLDSHLEGTHDASRGRPGALKRTLAGLDLLHEAGVPVRLSVMAHQDNLDTLGETVEFMIERYPGAMMNVDRVVATGGALLCDNGLTTEQFWDFLSKYRAPSVQAGRVCESAGIEAFEPWCGVAYSFVYVTAEGEVASCPTMTSRESPQFRGPHLSQHTLAEAWYDSEFFNAFRYTNCENVTHCPAGSVCGGGCRSNAYVELGSVTAPDTVACNENKNGTPVFVDFPTRYEQGLFGPVEVG